MKLRVFAFLTLLCAAAAFGDLGKYQNWDQGWVQHFLTKKDAKQFKKLATEKEAEEFVALFWAKRDPTPGTPRNEFREEKERLAKSADAKYATAQMAGSLTDRGKVMLLFGPPFASKEVVPTDSDGNLTNEGVRASQTQAKWNRVTLDVWVYRKENLARLPFSVPSQELRVEFKKEEGGKDFFLRTEIAAVTQSLAKAVEGYIKSPDMDKVPDWAKTMGVSPFEAVAAKIMSGEAPAVPEQGVLNTAVFFDSTKTLYGCALVFLPEEAFKDIPEKIQLYLLFRDKDGKVLSKMDEHVSPGKTPGGVYVDRSFIIKPGTNKLLIVIGKSDGTVLYSVYQDLESPDLLAQDAEGLWLTLSGDVTPLKSTSYETDPFVFGGVKVIPRASGVFKTTDDLWYFYNIFHPQLDPAANNAPKLTQKVEIYKDGKRIRGSQPTAPELTSLSEGRYASGNAYNIAQDLKLEPGSYTLKLTVKDQLSGKEFTQEKSFTVLK